MFRAHYSEVDALAPISPLGFFDYIRLGINPHDLTRCSSERRASESIRTSYIENDAISCKACIAQISVQVYSIKVVSRTVGRVDPLVNLPVSQLLPQTPNSSLFSGTEGMTTSK